LLFQHLDQLEVAMGVGRSQAVGRAWLMVADRCGSPGRGLPASGARGSGP
jgi:hypothetical protein